MVLALIYEPKLNTDQVWIRTDQSNRNASIRALFIHLQVAGPAKATTKIARHLRSLAKYKFIRNEQGAAGRAGLANGEKVPPPRGYLNVKAHVQDLIAIPFVCRIVHDIDEQPVLSGQLGPGNLDSRL